MRCSKQGGAAGTGVSREDRWAILGGKQVVPFGQTTPPFWVWNQGLGQLYMSVLHMRPDFLPAYVDALRRYRIEHIYGYSSSVYWLAVSALDTGATMQLKIAVTNAEPLFAWQRETIQRAFRCEVVETFGQTEKICAASQCEQGKLHLWPEAGLARFLMTITKVLSVAVQGNSFARAF